MAAIISGNSLGLSNSSLSVLGSQGALGTSQNGRANENVFVDSVTGNLVLQNRDELLIGRGPDLGLVRTYNSQGLLNDDNADNWRMGVYKKVAGLTGTVNTAGSTVRRTDGDGAESVYTYDATLAAYVNKDGGGAFDTLSFNATTNVWTFTDGASQVKELYDNANGGRITQMQDTDGNSLTYTYNAAGLITQVTDASGESTFLDYTGTNLTQIRTVMGTTTLTRVRYAYDASNRLSTVTVDLSPADNSVADGRTYVTTYTYDGTSKRVATLTQTDGTRLTFAYVQVGTAFKVSSITDALGQVTSFTYTASAASTTVNANPAALTTPTAGWAGASLLETSTTAASLPLIGSDGAGNAIAVWLQGTDLLASRYTKATGAWSAPTLLDNRMNAITIPQLYVDASGNAIVTWVQSNGTANSTYANRYVNGAWQGTELVETATVAVAEPTAAINGAGDAVVLWRQSNDLFANRFSGGAWVGAQSIEALTTAVATPDVAIDSQGNIQAIWRQSDGTANSIYTNRYTVGTGWAGASLLETSATAASLPSIGSDGAGNFIAMWLQGTDLLASRYTKATGTWSVSTVLDNRTNAITTPQLSVDASGNAIATWVQSDGVANSTYVNRFVNGAWQGTQLVETATVAVAEPSAAINAAGDAVVVWRQTAGTVQDLFASRFSGGAWSAAQSIEALATTVAAPEVAIDALGNIQAIWQQSDGTATNIYTNRYVADTRPYYTVLTTDTWSSIAQTVYGNATAGTALEAAMGNPALFAGLRLVVPPSVTFSGGQMTITDALGKVTVVNFDAAGELTGVTGPAVSGQSQQISYSYDASGNLTRAVDARGNAIDYSYDTKGNRVLERDAAGNTITRTFGAKNELLTQTVYLVPDPDGAGAGQAASPLTTRFAYSATNHLRFVVSAEGRVTEYRYNGFGQQVAAIQYAGGVFDVSALAPTATLSEAQLATWVGTADKTKSLRMDTTYDFRGQVASTTSYAAVDAAGNGVVNGSESVRQYVYDQAGNLLSTVDPRGVATPTVPNDFTTSYVYDGLNRVLSSTDALGRVTLTTYDDANRKVVLTFANGLVSTSTFDTTGQLVSVVQSSGTTTLGTTSYFYDADGRLRRTVDPTGVTTHILYDETGRQIGSIDGTGTLTEYRYNANNQLARTIQYATAVSTANLASLVGTGGAPTTVTLAAIRPAASSGDRSTWNAYDSANRLVKMVDELGFVTQSFYDGAGRVTDVVRYASAINTVALSDAPAVGAINPVSSASDRLTRAFYDGEGKLLGTLDGEGFLVEYKYDAAGQLIENIGYATVTAAALRTTGTLAQLRPAANANDIHGFTLYNAKGQVVGTVDGESFLTEYVYDSAGNKTQQIRYATRVTFTPGATIAAIRPASTALDQVSSFTYTALNQVASQTNFEGTLTTNTYDETGNLTQTVAAVNTADVRTLNAQYDKQGRLTAQLNGNGSALLTGGQTQAQIDAIWAANAIKYSYDAAGRRTSATDPNGNKALFYYDADGRLTHAINALGEVKENRYNVVGQLTQTIAYGTRLSATTLATLTGGLVNATLTSAVAGITNAALDATSSVSYTLRGQVASSTDPLAFATTRGYNAFGEAITQSQQIGSGQTLDHSYAYDKRGLLTLTAWDPAGINTTQITQYDAFGRVTQSTDANGNLRSQTYDKLGRVLTQVDPLNASRVMTYDAFARVLTQRDALNNTTTFAYSNANRSVTMTTAEGVVVTTVHSRFGQTQTVTDGRGGNTQYAYDKDGNLTQVTNALGQIATSLYDKADRLTETVDARGIHVLYTYDAANRVLTRRADPTGLNLTTTYAYDAKGQNISVTDSNGTVTQTQFDLKGEVIRTIVDPTGLNIRTAYAYDGRGKVVTLTEGEGSALPRVTQYTFDKLGRRTREQIDPAGLNLSTTYAYDKNSNAVTKTDPLGNLTRNVYDADNRLVYTIDPLGGVSEIGYDAEDRVVRKVVYAAAINLTGLSATPTIAQVQPLVTAIANPAKDGLQRNVYDRDGRLVYTVSGIGAVTQFVYDANGNVVDRISYANTIPTTTAATTAAVSAAVALVVDAAHDGRARTVYDALNRAIFTIDGTGGVTKFTYDANGNVVDRTSYATAIPTGTPATAAAVSAAVVNDAVHDLHTRMVYDNANRIVYVVDGLGSVTQNLYDADGNVIETIAYANKIPTTTAATAAAIQAALVPDAVRDGHTCWTYDAANRMVFSLDALGAVTQNFYDALGRVTEQLGYVNKVNVALPATAAAIQAALVPDATRDQATRLVYDAAGRQIYNIGSTGAVVQSVYDAESHLVRSVAYANLISLTSLGTNPTAATIQARIVASSTLDRVTQNVLDADEHVVYTIDALGFVTKNDYDAIGLITRTTRFANAVPSTTQATLAGVAAALTPNASTDQVDSFSYDAQGRLTQSTDALGFSEAYTYDALGHVRTFTNKKGSVCTYAYDAAGRMVTETSAVVEINTISATLVVTAQQASIVTGMQYDALGRVIARTEAQGRPEARTTRYAYDAAGHQVQTIFPPVNVYNAAGDNLSTNGATGNLTRVETLQTLTDTVTYDALGNGVVRRDVGGNFSYKVYDTVGRVRYEVDAERGATEYVRDAFGNATQVIRYATVLNSGTRDPALALTIADVQGMLNAQGAPAHANDRTITTTYDALNRITQVVQPAAFNYDPDGAAGQQTFTVGATTRNSYNAFGQVTQVQTLKNSITNTFVLTATNYYDKRGYQSATVNALGFLTTMAYDAEGNLTSQKEFAQALTSWTTASFGTPVANVNDRETRYAYDRENRKVSDTQVNIEFSTVTSTPTSSASVSTARGDVTTTYGYDAVGNLRRTTDAFGASTFRYYDVLGRVTAVVSPQRTNEPDATSVTPLSVFKLDAFGNAVQETDYALGAAAGASETSFAIAGTNAADRTSLMRYDTFGDNIQYVNANGASRFTSYDAFGRVAKQWQPMTSNAGAVQNAVHVYQYDKIGQQVADLEALAASPLSAASIVQHQTRYNTFGEMTARGINNGFQEYFDYDNAGRVWRTNTGDGVDKVSLYDLAGNSTADIRNQNPAVNLKTGFTRPDDVAALAGTVRTESRYDLLGRLVRRAMPVFGTTAPVINQTFDRWGNVLTISDPRSALFITQYRYNAFDQMIEQIQPDGNGAISAASPDTRLFYDKLGRRVAVQDANGRINAQRYDAAGDLVEDIHADAGHGRYGYNAFGNQVKMVDARGNATSYSFDRVGNLVQTTHAPVAVNANDGLATFVGTLALSETYAYDELGHRLRATNAAGATTSYDYDARGNVIKRTLPMGQVTSAAYDANSYKITEVDANNSTATWGYSYFGTLTAHTDLGGATYAYTYNPLNNLTAQTNSRGQNISYVYDAAGQLTNINDNAINQQTSYTYDAAGLHLTERTVQAGVTHQNNSLAYDTLGRLALVDDGRYHLTLAYDGVGNRTHETVHYVNDSGAAVDHDFWFAYDVMNRETIVDGVNTAGTIGISASQGHQLTYDLNGNRISDNYFGTTPVQNGVDESGNPVFVGSPAFVTRHYAYDAQNRLTVEDQDGLMLDHRLYDQASRLVRSGPDSGSQAIFDSFKEGVQIEFDNYDANNRLLRQRATGVDGSPRYDSSFTSYDGVGNLITHSVAVQTGTAHTNTYTSTYAKFDGVYRESSMSATSTLLQPGTTTETFDQNGNLVAVTDSTLATNNRTLVNDAFGRVLSKVQNGHTQHFLIVNGNVMGSSGDSATGDSFQGGVAREAFAGNSGSATLEDFSLSYTQIGTPGTLASTPGTYTVMPRDTLESVARTVWGDASLWYLIADANGLDGNARLTVGQQLVIPARVNGANNNVGVFRPYDALRAVGDTKPNLPAPPPQPAQSHGGGCGIIGMIIVAIIAIVVTIFLTPIVTAALTGAGLGATAAGIVGAGVAAAAGSIVSQGVGIAIGVQDKFNWKAVAVAGLTAGITQGITGTGGLNLTTAPADVALKAAINTAVNQGLRVAVGLQSSFNWRAVAASAVGAFAGAVVSDAIGAAQYGEEEFANLRQNEPWKLSQDFGNNFTREFGSGLVRNVVTTAVNGGKLDPVNLIADSFGNALGTAIGSYLIAPGQQQEALERARQQAAADARAAAVNQAPDTAPLPGSSQPYAGVPGIIVDDSGAYANLTSIPTGQDSNPMLSALTLGISNEASTVGPSIVSNPWGIPVGYLTYASPEAPMYWDTGEPANQAAADLMNNPDIVLAADRGAPRTGQVDQLDSVTAMHFLMALSAQFGPPGRPNLFPNHALDTYIQLTSVPTEDGGLESPFTTRLGAYNAMMRELANAGVTAQNASSQAVLPVRQGSTPDSLTAEILYQMGGAFQRVYEQNELLQVYVAALVENRAPGEFINVSPLWMKSVEAAQDRAGTSGWTIPLLRTIADSYVQNTNIMLDSDAPPALRFTSGRDLFFHAVTDAMIVWDGGKLVVWGGRALLGAAENLAVRRGFEGLTDALRTLARDETGSVQLPEWLLARFRAGNNFNIERRAAYPYNEVYINSPSGSGYTILDSYNPTLGEIVSRKFTQFADITEESGIRYVNQLANDYPVGATIARVPSNIAPEGTGLAGQRLQGQLILEVPEQARAIPQAVLDAATRRGVVIRDVNGRIH